MSSLAGKSVIVTRPKAQSDGLTQELQKHGATVIAMPVIEIEPPDSYGPLDDALTNLDRYDWVVLTSVNGVQAVAARLDDLGIPLSRLSERKLAAIGPATAAELAKVARQPDLVPDEYISEAIAEAIDRLEANEESEGRNRSRFLLARADIARRDLANLLRERGSIVDEVAAYRIVRSHGVPDLPEDPPEYITLTSSSAARSTYEILKENGRESWMSTAHLICIGPITSATVRSLGFEVAAEAGEYTVPGLIQALLEHADREPIHA